MDSLGHGSGLLQMVNLGQQLRRFVFKLGALRQKILFRIFSGAIFKVQVAQILVELFLAFLKIVEPRLLALAGEDILGPERVNKAVQPPSASRDANPIVSFIAQKPPSLRIGFAANPFAQCVHLRECCVARRACVLAN